jgi:hypothetical protein
MTYFVETKDGHFFRSTAIIRIEQSRRDDNICEAWSTAADDSGGYIIGMSAKELMRLIIEAEAPEAGRQA